ncbi:class I SAM-dependent methyltransferase [Alkalihalobacillus sp. AL-G]|uniref:class I SAM-dependent methyltransferase n=1 Tax=Alkalihalobacillus sp. AL-G TaxID=2926399 RepID=UPI00272BC55B|nr:class I SAM-dependent methyltransferase [Alkalihalobacillus sp. AL-G]WLD95379.1 methyltransferase domain-containing protein [Alkalihalobacillus sp. AL-G]
MNSEEFDQLVSFFDSMARTTWLASIHERLKELSGSWNHARVLDVGCGTGRLLLRGAVEADHLSGVDISSEMIKASQQNFFLHNLAEKSTFVTGDAYNLPFENDSFGISLSTCVMFLLPEPEKGLAEMIRVTKSEGKIAMLNPAEKMNQQNAFQYCKEHDIQGFEQTAMLKWSNVSTRRHRYATDQLTSILYKLGCEEEKHEEVLDGLAIITVATVR